MKVPFLSRLLEIKEQQLSIEGAKIMLLIQIAGCLSKTKSENKKFQVVLREVEELIL